MTETSKEQGAVEQFSGTDIREMVRKYYGETLSDSDDLKTNACCCSSAAPPKYVLDVLRNIDDDVIAHFYGCGSPIPPALEGATVLDLGCGTGRDVFVAAKLVGESGKVIGIDMTQSQLDFAEAHRESQLKRLGLERNNVIFIKSYIEDMEQIPSSSVDVAISNCVVNLSPFKQQLFDEIFRVLKPGGELYFSDIFSDRRVPEHFYDDPILRGECLSGAMYIDDFRRMISKCGVDAYYVVSKEKLEVGDFRIETKLGCIGFWSMTVRTIKSFDFEDREEDYGQTATYLGNMPENKRYFDLSEEIRLIKDKPVAISSNMATLLTQSRYARYFSVSSKRSHVGNYDYEKASEALKINGRRGRIGLEFLQDREGKLGIEPFEDRLHDKEILKTANLTTMQVNVGYRCNLACRHCYLECGPKRDEMMTRETMQAVLGAFASGGYKTMDITGGAPEMNPDLEWFIGEASKIASEVIVRSNLCILKDPQYAHFKQVYASNKVKLVASLPYFNEAGCDDQRGAGSFKQIIEVLRELNEIGYARDPQLQIDLVYNVDGPFLPPDQADLEDFYRYELQQSEHVEFNGLYAFNNYCLGRFAKKLIREHKLDYYMDLLADNYNAAVVARIMCRTQINVDWDGRLYDCEVNHVLGMPIDGPANVRDIVEHPLETRTIQTNPICYSCAAGHGSSCGGSLMEKYAQ